MSINQTPPTVTIVCDICGTSQTEDTNNYKNPLWESGWGLYYHQLYKNYLHLCKSCKPLGRMVKRLPVCTKIKDIIP